MRLNEGITFAFLMQGKVESEYLIFCVCMLVRTHSAKWSKKLRVCFFVRNFSSYITLLLILNGVRIGKYGRIKIQ